MEEQFSEIDTGILFLCTEEGSTAEQRSVDGGVYRLLLQGCLRRIAFVRALSHCPVCRGMSCEAQTKKTAVLALVGVGDRQTEFWGRGATAR